MIGFLAAASADRAPATSPSPPGSDPGGAVGPTVASLGVFAAAEVEVRDLAQQGVAALHLLGVDPENRVGVGTEMVVAHLLELREQGIELGLLGDEGFEAALLVCGVGHRGSIGVA